MTESSREDTEAGTDGSVGTESSPEPPENGLISDEQLPDDLQPAKNPLARNPGDEDDRDESGGPTEGKVEGMRHMAPPGFAGSRRRPPLGGLLAEGRGTPPERDPEGHRRLLIAGKVRWSL